MKKSCKSENQEHSKICEDFGKTRNEDSRGLVRLYSGRNCVSRYRGKLFGGKHLKRRKNVEFGPRTHNHAPMAWFMNIGHGQLGTHMLLEHVLCASCIQNVWGVKVTFLAFLLVKPAFLAQTQVETLTINTSLPHSEFLVQNWSSSRIRKFLRFGGVFMFSLFF